jgi:hypothetical protein
MAYFIFLKSLRRLEEFRKNSHAKIPPKSSCANFQSLGIFKNQILFGNHFFSLIPAQLAQPRAAPATSPAGRRACARPTRPEQPWRICQKTPLLRVCAVRRAPRAF